MSLDTIFSLVQTALELGLISALTVLALFLSYSMLNVCDLSTDGCFTLGATVGAAVAIAGHPYLSLPAAMARIRRTSTLRPIRRAFCSNGGRNRRPESRCGCWWTTRSC